MKVITKKRLKEVFNNFDDNVIAVIGDVMLDRYFWGNVSRVSPEAPVPVIDLETESFHLGGAANVASNLNSLGVNSILCGLIGNDNSGQKFRDICGNNGIDPKGLFVDNNRPTTVKTRIIGNNQQMVRLDRETRDNITPAGEKFIVDILSSEKKLSGIIFADYNKGAISPKLIKEVIKLAKSKDIPVYVDPKFNNFFEYKNVTVLEPNRKEAAFAMNKDLDTDDDFRTAGLNLMKKLNCENVLLTLGDKGMLLFEKDGNISHVETKARHVADVSGAGDTVIATLAAAVSSGTSMKEAATIANLAAGYVCGEPGIVSVSRENILSYLQ